MQCFEDRRCVLLPYSPAIFIAQVARLPFDFVEAGHCVQRLLGQLAFIRHVQVEELAPGVGHAADFGDALLEPGLVAGKVVTDQLAVPLAEEVARMLAGAAGAEIVDYGAQVGEGRGAVGPDVSPVSFLLAWSKHLYRGFIGVDHVLGQHCFAQRIDQRLKLYAGLPNPLG
ncbi:hypothetical protein D9M71_269900 [compost metagenome]